MIVDRLHTEIRGERAERSARLRWIGGEFTLRVDVPAAYAAPEKDASPYVGLAMMLAAARHEDLYLDGEVCPQLMRNSRQAQRTWAAWDPSMRLLRVRAAAEAPLRAPAPGVASFMSRGLDSLFAATREREPPALTHLIFCDTLEPVMSERTRDEERRLAGEVAERLGLELVIVSTNLRDPGAQLLDYLDLHGMGLALMGLSLSARLGRLWLPPGVDVSTMTPQGTTPMLEPLFSTTWMAMACDDLTHTRFSKAAALVSDHPELLPYIKVCFEQDRADNCGRCPKCLRTMACLQGARGLELATSFPDTIDLERVRTLQLDDLLMRLLWAQTGDALADSDPALQAAIREALRRGVRPSLRERTRILAEYARGERERPDPAWSHSASRFMRVHTNISVALVKGRPLPPYGIDQASGPPDAPSYSFGAPDPSWSGPPAEPPPGLAGLVRLIDRAGGRHRYAVGTIPPLAGLARAGELGALLSEPAPDALPVWLTAEGQLEAGTAEAPDARPLSRARWVGAPLRWRGVAPLPRRAREALRRGLAVARLARAGGDPGASAQRGAQAGEPAGWLHPAGGDGRLRLWSALHPVTGDQLISTDEREAPELGYGEATPLGWLEAAAPMTGQLGVSQQFIPWAARFGHRA